ncbi:hypothetical protein [Actinomadura sp. NBRC 104425]|uniref:hypothetical protein n=1 Tax=Actinomadura sp. NBRC 104425 TaxID=3032204 RepID=UPI002555BAD2|nr:hypothetical protein [Actinomadura sp. NBRC 104425]
MRTLRFAAVALAAVTSFGLAGCGEENPPVSQSEQDKMVKFAECMRKHGVEIPDRGPNAPEKTFDPNDVKMQAAQAACRSLAPDPHQEGKPSAAQEDRALKLAECLRKRGINAKDPEPGSIQISIEENPNDDPQKTVAAYAACNKEVPAVSGG